MIQSRPRSRLTTHEVQNQPPARGDIDLWKSDIALQEAVARNGGHTETVAQYGGIMGTADMRQTGMEANRHHPEPVLFDPGGRRLDEVRFHPAWHKMMQTSLTAGYAGVAWDGTEGGQVAHAAMIYIASQVEPGHCCPMTMTYAAVPALAADPDLSAIWQPRLSARGYDPRPLPIEQKPFATLGMAMTEKQGGSDLRANTTTATPDGDVYRLNGHKWFCSAPMSDGFLTLAQAPGGLTCFLVPRWLEGERNAIQIMRLKDKLGNRSNASSEIEYHNALAWRLGEEGRGIRTIIEMVHHTRLDTCLAPAGLMRGALAAAVHWARHRSAFQRRLIDQPLMQAVLADMVLDIEGQLALGLHVARAFDGTSAEERAFARIGVALGKFLGNKRCPIVTYEAMEVLGGMGYIEETGQPLFYREAPLNGIWEGSGNVICLDILRSLAKEPLAAEVLRNELATAKGTDRRYDAARQEHLTRWPSLPPEGEARWFAERTALLLTASVLIRAGISVVAEAYVTTRIAGERGHVTGAMAGTVPRELLDRI